MRLAWPSLLLLLLAAGALGEGSFNRIPSVPAPATAEPAPGASPEGQAEAEAQALPDAAPDPEAASEPREGEGGRDPESSEPARRFEKACIYGPKGLLYAPPGIACDPEEAASAAPGGGRCILGLHGEVLHAPVGVNCEGLIGAGTTPPVRRSPAKNRRIHR